MQGVASVHFSIRSYREIITVIVIVILVGGTIFMEVQDSPKRQSFRNSAWWEYIQVFAVAFVLVFGFMRPFVVEAFKIPSASMENTLLIGDRILVSKFIYGIRIPLTDVHILDFHKPERGDIFVFKPPAKSGRTQNFIKRIVGLPGDTIEVRRGRLYRNGEPVVPDEDYVKRFVFSIDPRFQNELDKGNIPDNLRRVFSNARTALSDSVTVSTQDKGSRWSITDASKGTEYFIRKDKAGYGLNVYVNESTHSRLNTRPRRGLQEYPPLLFTTELGYQIDLDNGNIPEGFRQAFERRRVELSPEATVSIKKENSRWIIADGEEEYHIRKHDSGLDVCNSPFTVPSGHVFAMGDNRDQSNDSRAWGPVPYENIKGQAFIKYWSWNSDAGWLNKIRFSRIGRVLR